MNSWRALWREPRPTVVPARSWRDWALVGVGGTAALAEAAFRPDVVWRPWVTLVGLAVMALLLWRRSHPLHCVVAGFGLGMVLTTAQLVWDERDVGLYSMIVVLVLLYALVRWGSGREIVLGLGFVLVAAAYGMAASFGGPGDLVGGAIVLFAAVADGAAFRYRADLWDRQLTQIRSQERVGLARELHDTVAHHVSAIAVQAQAGQAVARTRPEAAVEALSTIELEASRTLAEMRGMVRVLREGADPEYAPAPGVADLATLARTGPSPRVEVRLEGGLDALPGPVDAALFRMAQESLTNALRHARGASRVEIRVVGESGRVRLVVRDDGTTDPTSSRTPGYGLLGMAERAQLLGGTLVAGPEEDGGWVVRAELPREGG